MALMGYSEKGIFYSIAYFLDNNQEYVKSFIEILDINIDNNFTDYIFLVEQSFSDFGDSDLVLCIRNKEQTKKIVLFFEGKVKTFKGTFSIEKEKKKIKNAIKNNSKFTGISSNIFVQLYYKYLLVTTNGKGNPSDHPIFLKSNNKERTLGENEIVRKAFNYIKKRHELDEYYYVAIIPEDKNNDDFHKYMNDIKIYDKEIIPTPNTRLCYWGNIDNFFSDGDEKKKKVKKTFKFNKTRKGSQIYLKSKNGT